MIGKHHRSGILYAGLAAGVAAAALLSAHTAAQAKVGVAAAVNVDAKGRPPGSAARVISLGQNVVFNEEITTDGRGLVQVLLLDGTTFTVGPNSQLRIDEFVYDPNTGDARVIASVTKGAFRFIGGQTSRKPGGATINTPVGTIGIRGAMVEGGVEGGAATFSMIFGDEVLFTGRNGATSRIYQPGYTMEVSGGGQANVRRRTKEDAQTFQTALAGGGDQSGGASEQPTDTTVSSSPVTAVNSNLPNQGPIPEGRPATVQATGIDQVEEQVAQIENVTQEDLRQDVVEEEPEPEPEPDTTQARILTAPEAYDPYDSDETIPNAGSRGLVGSAPESDRQIVLVRSNGRLVSDDAGIDLPDVTGIQGDNGLERINVFDGESPDGAVTGPAYAGAGDFAAYLLGINDDPTRPFYLIHGTPADFSAVSAAGGDNIRHYSLTPDPIRGAPAPFFAPDLYGEMNSFSSTDYLIVEPGAAEDGRWRTFLSWVSIEGDGAEQKSATGLTASSIFGNEEDDHAIGGSRRGSFRAGGQTGPVVMRGGIGTIGNGDGDHFYGGNLENFVIGSGVTPPDAFYDNLLGPGFTFDPGDGYLGDGIFGTHHVADLQTEVPKEALSRTSRVRSGYMAGNAESTTLPAGSFTMLTSGETPNLHLELNAQENRMFAAAEVGDYFDFREGINGLQLSFGAGEGGSGGNTFVDDNVFGATQNNNRENTRFLTDGGQSVAHASSNPGSYIVSGRANPIAGYQHCAGCDFIDWGWWGTQAIFDGNGTEELPEARAEYVHMGTWVAGDITATADLPTNISATFEGTVLGNVYSHETDSQYIAAGNVEMSYDFGSRSGTININDYADLDFSGIVGEGGSEIDAALFIGSLSGPGVESSAVTGAFVNDGDDHVAGIMGDFVIEGTVIDSVGTIVGRRTGTGEAPTTVSARVLTSPELYQPVSDPEAYPAVGERGLVGSTPETDRNLAFARLDSDLVFGDGLISLPDLTGAQGDDGLTGIAVVDAQYQSLGASGTAYAGKGDFAAYLLGIQGDPTRPLYVISGTPTPASVLAGLNTGTQVREYTLTTDPIRPSPLPFFANDLYGDATNFNSSNLFIVESDTAQFHDPGATIFDAKAFQSWVTIDGEGTEQKSGALVFASEVFETAEGPYRLSAGRRGTFRHGALEGPANMRGGLGAIEGPSGDSLFGPDLDHFVLGAPVTEPDGFSDALFGPGFSDDPEDGYLGTGYPFSTHHVADLVDKTPQGSLSRTTRTSLGFMTGMVESTNEGRQNPYIVGSDFGPNFVVHTNATYNSVIAAAELQDVYDPLVYGPSAFDGSSIADSYLISFGPGEDSGGSSAFVDDDRFGAVRNGDNENTRLRTDGGQDLANREGDNPGSYMVSGKANPIAGFGHCTDCAFLDWGWWGTRVRVAGDGTEIVDEQRSDYLHMGTWVAGDISNPADLPTNITASYSGTAVGNVARQTTDGVAKYIAQGGMNMSFDFNSRTGNMQISDFDGMNLISELSDRSTGSHALFGGQLDGSGVAGNVTGAFVNDGPNVAAGVIGNFGVAGPGVTATGTIAGTRD